MKNEQDKKSYLSITNWNEASIAYNTIYNFKNKNTELFNKITVVTDSSIIAQGNQIAKLCLIITAKF